MNTKSKHQLNELSVVLAGEAGQGVQAIASILTRAFRQEGYHVFVCHEFMSRIRGGSNSKMLRISSGPLRAWTERIDLCIVYDEKAISHLGKRLDRKSIILGEGIKQTRDLHLVEVPLARLADEAGGRIFVNTVSAGMLWGILGGGNVSMNNAVTNFLAGKQQDVIEKTSQRSKAAWSMG